MSKLSAKDVVAAEQRLLMKKKDVHLMMSWNAYARARATLFQYNLTLTECFNEFAELLASEHSLAQKIVDRCYRNAMQRKLNALNEPTRQVNYDALDANAIYGLIDDGRSDELEEDE